MTALRTLREHVESDGPLGVLDAVGWIARAAKTLAIVHKEERVHGAISADAILISAASCDAEGALAHPDDVAEAPLYHCPDRAAEGEASYADDVWALCNTLFYALTGALPFPHGVLSWIKAEKRQPPPIAVHGADLAVMEVVLAKLLDANAPSSRIPKAAVFVLHLRGLSPKVAELPPVPLREPRAEQALPEVPEVTIPLPPALPEIRMGDIVIVSADMDGSIPAPSPALLASLPPAPMRGPEAAGHAPPPQSRALVPVLVAMLIVMSIAVVVLALLR